MNPRATLIIAFLGWAFPAAAHAARNSADLQPPQMRQTTVANAERLWRRPSPPPLPADLVSPFNPANFDKPDPSELGSAPAAGSSNPADARGNALAGPARRLAPLNDREILDKLAAQIAPTGTILLRGSPRLVISNKPFEVGTRFTATYNNQDYELELVAIDRTTFTLRYRNEEIIRPIKPVR